MTNRKAGIIMRISGLGYAFKQGMINVFRNKWFSLASLATMTACVFLFGLFYSLVTNFEYIVKSAEKGVAVTVFFDDGISQEKIDAIGQKIGERSEVLRLDFISAEQAWENCLEKYFKGSEELAEGFKEDNPLANSASYEVYVKDIEQQTELVDYISSLSGVRKVNQSEAAASALTTFNILIGYVSAAIIGVLLLVSVFLISNTVTIGITIRKEEIGIMKLIGAKDSFVRLPFLIEGMLIGLSGSVIPMVLLYFVYTRVVGYILNNFIALTGFLKFLSAAEIFRTLAPVSIALGLGIGLLGSLITVRRHLRVS